jgi:hypothetical protein
MSYFREIEQIICDGEWIAPEKRMLLPTELRDRDLVMVRQLVMYFLRLFNGERISWASIGSNYNRDHSTAIHGCNHINDLIDSDKAFAEKVNAYKSQIESIITFEKNLVLDNLDQLKARMKQFIDDNISIPPDMLSCYNSLIERTNETIININQDHNKIAV